MADSTYDKALDVVAAQVKTLIAGVDSALLPESSLSVREFDWDDINSYPGTSLRTVNDPEILSQFVDDTTESTNVGYPFVIVANWAKNPKRDTRMKNVRKLFQDIRHYYHHKRRLQDANEDGVAMENSCTVRPGGPSPPADFKLNRGVAMITVIGWFMERRALV